MLDNLSSRPPDDPGPASAESPSSAAQVYSPPSRRCDPVRKRSRGDSSAGQYHRHRREYRLNRPVRSHRGSGIPTPTCLTRSCTIWAAQPRRCRAVRLITHPPDLRARSRITPTSSLGLKSAVPALRMIVRSRPDFELRSTHRSRQKVFARAANADRTSSAFNDEESSSLTRPDQLHRRFGGTRSAVTARGNGLLRLKSGLETASSSDSRVALPPELVVSVLVTRSVQKRGR